MKKGRLYLIPTALSAASTARHLTPAITEVLRHTRYFVAEHAREARRYISALKLDIDISALSFTELNKHTDRQALHELLAPTLAGHDLGLLSDAGCPAVADPGADLVLAAQRQGIRVVPLPGPSAPLLALMASGLGGQRFRFAGYLPVDKKELRQALRDMEKRSARLQETQLFIETPYRTARMLHSLLDMLQPDTLLCLAANLTAPDEMIITLPVKDWRKLNYRPGKVPAVFLLLAPA